MKVKTGKIISMVANRFMVQLFPSRVVSASYDPQYRVGDYVHVIIHDNNKCSILSKTNKVSDKVKKFYITM